jgi:hypothetical protein
MLVMLLVMVVGVLMTTATAGAVQAQTASLQYKRDQAYYAAEAGVQRALYEVLYGSWQSTFVYPTLQGHVGNCSYTANAQGGGWNSVIVVSSIGTYPSNPPLTCAVSVTISPTVLVPAISLGSGLSEKGKLTVDGNAMVKSNIDLGGLVSITGSLIYGGVNNGKSDPDFHWADPTTIPRPPQVWFDPSESLAVPANVVNVTPLIKMGSGARALGSNSPQKLDFRSASNGVLFFFGDVTLDSVDWSGAGTLVVFGNITIKKSGFGDKIDQVNLIATGSIQTQADFRIYGSLYANGNITHQGQFDVTGTINAQQSMFATTSSGGDPDKSSGSGGATINRAPTPIFDPRPTVGSGSMRILNYTGPSF